MVWSGRWWRQSSPTWRRWCWLCHLVLPRGRWGWSGRTHRVAWTCTPHRAPANANILQMKPTDRRLMNQSWKVFTPWICNCSTLLTDTFKDMLSHWRNKRQSKILFMSFADNIFLKETTGHEKANLLQSWTHRWTFPWTCSWSTRVCSHTSASHGIQHRIQRRADGETPALPQTAADMGPG